MSDRTLPLYRELPYHEKLGGRVSWGVFGDDDELGTIGLIGDAETAAAAREIQRGARFPLCLPLNEPDPPPGDRAIYKHHIVRPTRNTQDEWLDGFYPSSSTQWD